jgi:hypothetical protein
MLLAYLVFKTIPPRSTYVLTVSAGTGGSTNPAPGSYSEPQGAGVSVTAVSSSDYNFDHWMYDGVNVGLANPYTVTMNGNHTLTAVFNKATILYIDPQTIKRGVGQDFIINISISNVADLYGWQLQLSWDKIILDVVNVTEGTFLKSHGQTFFNQKINETGSLLSVCNRWGNVSGINGSGVLATVQFHVKESGECDLYLYKTILVSSSEKSITHIVKSGKFST